MAWKDGDIVDYPDGTSKRLVDGAWVDYVEPEGNFLWQKGPIDTRGEQVGADIGKAIGSGIQQGVAGIASLPNLVEKGVNWMAGRERETMPSYGDITGAMTGAGDTLEDMLGLERSVRAGYEPETRAGKYAQTAAEFFSGAFLGGGGMAGARSVVAPAVISETAGQLTEGTAAEPYARAVGAIAGPTIANAVGKGATGVQKASQGRRAAAKRLKDQGVKPTAGQQQGGNAMIYMEDAADPNMFREAVDSYTDAVINRIPKGRESLKIKPVGDTHIDRLDSILNQTTSVMDDLAANNTAVITPTHGGKLLKLADQYDALTGEGVRSPFIRKVATDLVDGVTGKGGVMSGPVYQDTRTMLGQLTKSADPSTRKAAGEMIDLLDDAMEASIKAKGNQTDILRYRDARSTYRDAKTAEEALVRGENMGRISPADLKNAAKLKEKTKLARGNSIFNDLIEDGQEVLRFPKSSGTAERGMAQTMMNLGAGGTAGGALGFAVGGVPGMLGGMALGAAAPGLRNAGLASPAGQMMATNLQKLLAPARTASKDMMFPLATSVGRGVGNTGARVGPLLPQFYDE